jgi:hypothetical protein
LFGKRETCGKGMLPFPQKRETCGKGSIPFPQKNAADPKVEKAAITKNT